MIVRDKLERDLKFLDFFFIHHMKPMDEKSNQKKFQPISTINGKVMAILMLALIAGLASESNLMKSHIQHFYIVRKNTDQNFWFSAILVLCLFHDPVKLIYAKMEGIAYF